jgi:uncharacterized membrane protein
MKFVPLAFSVAAGLTLAACGQTTASRTVSGGAMGAAGGAVIGAMAGNAGLGAAIGAGTGLVGGYLYDQQRKGNIDY